MIKAQIEITRNRLPALRQGIRRQAAQVVSEAATDCVALAKVLAPVDTGELRDEIHTEAQGDLAADAVSSVPHSIFNEFGTVKMAAQPYMTPAAEEMHPRFLRRMASIPEEAARG